MDCVCVCARASLQGHLYEPGNAMWLYDLEKLQDVCDRATRLRCIAVQNEYHLLAQWQQQASAVAVAAQDEASAVAQAAQAAAAAAVGSPALSDSSVDDLEIDED